MAQAAVAKDFTFVWEGTDKKGQRVKGQNSGASESLIRAQLRKQGITPIKVKKKSGMGGKGKAITSGDISIFSRQMSTMMKAGVPLVQSLQIVGSGHENPNMATMIMTMKTHIEAGNSFASALAIFPLYFDNLFVNLVDAGEKSGALEALLDKIATYKEKTEAIKKKVKKALTYPIAVLVVAFVVAGILLYFVVPQFQALFQGFGADLPGLTQMVVDLSEWLQANWYILLGVIGAMYAGISQAFKRSEKFRHGIDRLMLRLPIIGDILYKSAVARFSRTLSTMFAAGVPLVDALDSVAKAAGNIVYEQAIMAMKDQVSTGLQLQLAMNQAGVFPPLAVQMIAIGEESGALDAMCAKVADFYEAEVDALVDSLSSLMEPIIMAFLGGMVGTLIIAMYLPIFKMGSAV
ncbi:MAG: type II secretion system F family protein [Pseudomonadota bacterium]